MGDRAPGTYSDDYRARRDEELRRMPEDLIDDPFRERHLARLLITLYCCGEPVTSLLEGDTRQIESPARLQRFDFWMREPGHLALALLHDAATHPSLAAHLTRMTADGELDKRRVPAPSAPYRFYATLDAYLSFLTGAALITDRPSFAKSQPHQVVLETAGITLVEKILAECPSFGWYKAQGDLIATQWTALERVDLTTMPYLAPDLTPALAAAVPLTPYVISRADQLGLREAAVAAIPIAAPS